MFFYGAILNNDKSLSHLEPASIEEELEQSKNWNVQIQFMAFVVLLWIQKLPPDQAEAKVRVNSNSDYLHG